MYPLAKNKTIFTKEIFDEGYDRLYGVPYRKAIRKFIGILLALLIVASVLIFILKLPIVYLLTEGIFIVFLILYILIILPGKNKKNIYKKLHAGCSEPDPWRNYDFYEDHFVIGFPDGTTESCNYQDIESIYKGKNVYGILTKGQHNALVDKNRFTGELPEILR